MYVLFDKDEKLLEKQEKIWKKASNIIINKLIVNLYIMNYYPRVVLEEYKYVVKEKNRRLSLLLMR